MVRVMTNPKYSSLRQFDVDEIALALKEFAAATDHLFWPDEVSITDQHCFAVDKIHGPRQLTDTYLLALAVANGGRLVTFDQRISTSAVLSAQSKNLVLLGDR